MAGFTQKPEDALRAVADRLVGSYADHDLQRDHAIRDLVRTEAARFDEAAVKTFVPILVERAARRRTEATMLP